MASAPYTAEAPPVTKSTRLNSASGITLVSTDPSKLNGVTRRPLINTSERFEPKPRRSMVAPPPEPLLVPGPMPGSAADRLRTNSSTATGCDTWISCAEIEVIGLDDTAPGVRIRLPVISTR